MRNIQCVACACHSEANIETTDGCVDKISSDLWISSKTGVASLNKHGFERFFTDKCIEKILYVNAPCVCLMSKQSVMLVQIPDQVRSLQ